MRRYIAPAVPDFGSITDLTGITGDPVEQDTYVTSTGLVGHQSGPNSEIFCQTNANREICT